MEQNENISNGMRQQTQSRKSATDFFKYCPCDSEIHTDYFEQSQTLECGDRKGKQESEVCTGFSD